MRLSSFHHVAIIGSDLQQSRHFYVDVLGFSCVREVHRAERNDWMLVLRLGDMELELFIMPSSPARLSYPEATGLRHLAFHVEDIEQVVSTLQASGVVAQPLRIDPYTGERMTFFMDPDGLPLELREDRMHADALEKR